MNLISDILLATDAHRYAILAQNLLKGNGYTLAGAPELIFPPGYSLLLTLPLLIFDHSSAVLILMLASLFSLITGLFFLVRKYINKYVGLITALFVALNGNILLYTLVGYTEIVMFALVVWSLYLIDFDNKRKLFWGGVLSGLAYLVKPEAILYLFLFLVFQHIEKKVVFNKSMLYLFFPILVCVVTYSSYLYAATGKLALSGKTATLEWDRYIENPSVNRDSIIYRLNEDLTLGPSIREFSIAEVNFLQRGIANTKTFKMSLFEILLPLKLTLVALLISFIAWRKSWKMLIAVILFNIPVSLTLLFHVENRYLLPILLTALLILSFSASKLIEHKKWLRNNILVVIPVISTASLLALTYYSFYPLAKEPQELITQQKETIDWLSENKIEEQTILARKPVYSFLLEKDYAPLPYTTDKENLAHYLESHDNAVILLDRWSYYSMPEIHNLIYDDFESGKKEIVRDKKVLIFENW